MPHQPINHTRRSFLHTSVRWSLAAALVPALPAHATQCVDPEELATVDYQFRKYVKYTESSPDPGKTCSGCAFFKSGEGECGTCQVVAGLINVQGRCDSWEQKK